MDTLAILFVGAGALLLRQVFVGRVSETAGDIRDFANAVLQGDMSTAQEVFSRRGSNVSVDTSSGGTVATTTGDVSTDALVNEMVKLGTAAKGYSQANRTGPDYYDCSGLVWKALSNLGIYDGSPFWTGSFETVAKTFATRVDTPTAGDIVVWPYHHMGVMTSATQMYAARSSHLSPQIGYDPVSAISSKYGSPHYWRIVGASPDYSGKDVSE